MEQYSRFGPPPEATLAALMRMRETLGITRVADITGLDRVGIPVVQVTRPCSLSNTVAQGKGTSLGRAAISAMLEIRRELLRRAHRALRHRRGVRRGIGHAARAICAASSRRRAGRLAGQGDGVGRRG